MEYISLVVPPKVTETFADARRDRDGEREGYLGKLYILSLTWTYPDEYAPVLAGQFSPVARW